MKKIAIVGLGWLGMPLALSLIQQGYEVVGTKTTEEGVAAARMSGVVCYQLVLTPEVVCEAADLALLLHHVDTLVITLPASRSVEGSEHYAHAVRMLAQTAMAFDISRIIFTSSTSVYGDAVGRINEDAPLNPVTPAGRVLAELEGWLRALPDVGVDILRLAGLVGKDRHPGRFLAGKTGITGGGQGVNLVHQDDVVAAIELLLRRSRGWHIYNLCAAIHPIKREFYPLLARQLGLPEPQFVEEESQPGRLVDGKRICGELGFKYQYPDPAQMPIS